MELCKSQKSMYVIYDVKYRYEAEFISEFFKLIGFFVVSSEFEKSKVKYADMIKESNFYHHMIVLGMEDIDNEAKIIGIHGNKNFVNEYETCCEKIIKNLFDVVMHVFNTKSALLSALVSCYVKKDYCRNSYIKRNFGKSLERNQQFKLKDDFLNMYHELDAMKLDGETDLCFHLEYAKLLVARKIDDICLNVNIGFMFPLEEMIVRCKRMVEKNCISASASILAASYCSLDASYHASIVPFYEDALRGWEKHPAAVHIYYMLGQFYEKKCEDYKLANRSYEMAVKISPNYYRALFKKGAQLLDVKEFSDAISVFNRLIDVFGCKRENQMLFPIEYEYLCKCYLLLGRIYDFYWDDRQMGNWYYEQATDLIEEELQKSSFFEDFLGDGSNHFLEYLKKRIAVREVVLKEKYRYIV